MNQSCVLNVHKIQRNPLEKQTHHFHYSAKRFQWNHLLLGALQLSYAIASEQSLFVNFETHIKFQGFITSLNRMQ